jgi:hypothetical protein
VLCCVLASALAPARAQVLIGEFALNSSLNNNVPGGPSLALLPFAGVSGQITALGYVFARNQGLTFTSPALNPASYSIEFSFKTNLDTPSSWSKLVDLAGLNSDAGLYIHNSGGERLQFYPQPDGNPADFTVGPSFDVVLTRDGVTGTVRGYVNGQLRFSFTDSSSQAVVSAANNTLTFFVDDHNTGQNEVSGGTLNYLRVFNGALTSTQVSALFAAGAPSAVPEPATAVLLALGGVVLVGWRRRRAGAGR